MKFNDYVNEEKLYINEMSGKMNNILTNMVAVARREEDMDYVSGVVDKALKSKMINSKQHVKLKKEIEDLRRSL